MKNCVASIQLTSSDDIAENLATIEQLVIDAVKQGAKLILLPENCAFMGKKQGETIAIAEPLGEGDIQRAFSTLAKTQKVWIVVGAMATIEQGKIYQTLLVYNAEGERMANYHKRHLFNVTLPNKQESYRESDAFEYGEECVVIETPVGKLGLAICYDLRFPEQFRQLVDMGAEVFVLPAAFTYQTGKAHWEVLLRVRAIENQCYMIAAAQTGRHVSGRETWGHSMVINPWGEVLASLGHEVGFVTAEIDMELLYQQREVFPALTHRI